jgi:hypothetical protein
VGQQRFGTALARCGRKSCFLYAESNCSQLYFQRIQPHCGGKYRLLLLSASGRKRHNPSDSAASGPTQQMSPRNDAAHKTLSHSKAISVQNAARKEMRNDKVSGCKRRFHS